MTAEQFAYWMQGFAELTGDEPPSAAQWKSIREHLQTVFTKTTPPIDFTKQPGFVPFQTRPSRTGDPLPRPPYEVTCRSVSGHTAAETFC